MAIPFNNKKLNNNKRNILLVVLVGTNEAGPEIITHVEFTIKIIIELQCW